jgi:hypothetical protein
VDVELGSNVGIGASVALGGALGRAVGTGVIAAAVGRQALGVVASGWPQPAEASISANMDGAFQAVWGASQFLVID